MIAFKSAADLRNHIGGTRTLCARVLQHQRELHPELCDGQWVGFRNEHQAKRAIHRMLGCTTAYTKQVPAPTVLTCRL